MLSPWIVGTVETRKSISLPLTRQHDPAVLGQAPLRDVQFGHDLDTGDDGGLKPFGHGLDVMEDAIDSVAHPE